MNVYQIDDGEQHWYAAESKEDALRLHLEPLYPFGTDLTDLYKLDQKILENNIGCSLDEVDIGELSPDTILPVNMDDGNPPIKKTAAEWADEGRGLIATTAY